MPSSLEILEPKGLRLETNQFAGLINDLLARLHQIDMVLKGLRAVLIFFMVVSSSLIPMNTLMSIL